MYIASSIAYCIVSPQWLSTKERLPDILDGQLLLQNRMQRQGLVGPSENKSSEPERRMQPEWVVIFASDWKVCQALSTQDCQNMRFLEIPT